MVSFRSLWLLQSPWQILRSLSSVGNPSVFTLSLSVKRFRFFFLGGASVTILALFCTRQRTRTRSGRDNWRLPLVRSSRLSALDESSECPVLTTSSFFRPVFFLIRPWESVESLLVVIDRQFVSRSLRDWRRNWES
jgi:hypothetical protein